MAVLVRTEQAALQLGQRKWGRLSPFFPLLTGTFQVTHRCSVAPVYQTIEDVERISQRSTSFTPPSLSVFFFHSFTNY